MEVFMNRMWPAAALFATLSLVATLPARAGQVGKTVDRLGPYAFGADYGILKNIEKFEDDPSRDEPDKGIKAARVAAPFLGQPAIQRLFFKGGKLASVTVIFGNPAFGEQKVKDVIAKEWGDPGPKMPMGGGNSAYVWIGTRGIVMIVPVSGGLWSANLYEK
jgi:hypothetical protein